MNGIIGAAALHTVTNAVYKVIYAFTLSCSIPFAQNIVRSVDESAKESIHLCDFPVYNAEQVDEKLEADMDLVLKIVVLGRACRNGAAIKNRQPIGQMYVKAEASLPDYDEAIILDELNVKNITFTDDVSNFTTYNFKC